MSENKKDNKRGAVYSWSMYDWASSAFATTVLAAVLPIYYSQVAGAELAPNTATVYWGYTLSISLFLTAVIAPIMGAVADYSGVKKKLLLTFAGSRNICDSAPLLCDNGGLVYGLFVFHFRELRVLHVRGVLQLPAPERVYS